MILDVLQIKVLKECLKGLISLFDFDEKLLCMRSGLSARSSANMLLHASPLFPEEFKRLKEAEVLILSPSSML